MTRRALAGALAGIALLLTGCSGAAPEQPAQPPAVVAPAFAPAGISVPAIGADSDLVGLGRDAAGGWAIPPLDEPGQASWFTEGAPPGEPGNAVILGHINGCVALGPDGRCAGGHAPGVFVDLAKMKAGDVATVRGADDRLVEFVATEDARTVTKTDFPTAEIVGPTGERRLWLISCGGDYDPGDRRYLSNVIVPMVAR